MASKLTVETEVYDDGLIKQHTFSDIDDIRKHMELFVMRKRTTEDLMRTTEKKLDNIEICTVASMQRAALIIDNVGRLYRMQLFMFASITLQGLLISYLIWRI